MFYATVEIHPEVSNEYQFAGKVVKDGSYHIRTLSTPVYAGISQTKPVLAKAQYGKCTFSSIIGCLVNKRTKTTETQTQIITKTKDWQPEHCFRVYSFK